MDVAIGWVVVMKSIGMRCERSVLLHAARVICGLGRCHSQRYIGDMQVVRYILIFSVSSRV